MVDLLTEFGESPGKDEQENQHLAFAVGVYETDLDSHMAGLVEHEILYDSAPEYALNNGTTLKQLLSNAYYQAGLDNVTRNDNPQAMDLSIEMFELARQTGDGNQVDVHHGKAIAYFVMNDEAKFEQEMDAIWPLDQEYYKTIVVSGSKK